MHEGFNQTVRAIQGPATGLVNVRKKEDMTVSSSDAFDVNANHNADIILDMKIGIITDLMARGYSADQAKTIVQRAHGTTPEEIEADAQSLADALSRVTPSAPLADPLTAAVARKGDTVRRVESALGATPSLADIITNRLAH